MAAGPRINIITLGVDDVPASRAFYERLGFVASGDSNASVAFFDAGGVVLALFGREALADDAHVANVPKGFGGVTVAWNVASDAEVEAALAKAVAAGAQLVKPGQKVFWGGFSGYFADPDGHLWEVAHNPFWPIDAAGRLQLPAPLPAANDREGPAQG